MHEVALGPAVLLPLGVTQAGDSTCVPAGCLVPCRLRAQGSEILTGLQQWPSGSKLSHLIKRLGGWDPPKENKSEFNQIFYLENVFQLRDLGRLSLLGSQILMSQARVET